MTLSEAIESKRGLPYQQIFDELSEETVSVLGAIRGENLRDVVAVLASGLQYRLDTMTLPPEFEPLRAALLVGFRHISIPDYAFNLAQPDVMGMLLQAVQVGLVSNSEHDKFVALATYETAKYPGLSYRDIIANFEPELVDIGAWSEPFEYQGGKLFLTLTQALPEPSLVRIEVSESINGENWTAFKRISHFYEVSDAGTYSTDIPRTNLKRRIRWRGENYRVAGSVVGV